MLNKDVKKEAPYADPVQMKFIDLTINGRKYDFEILVYIGLLIFFFTTDILLALGDAFHWNYIVALISYEDRLPTGKFAFDWKLAPLMSFGFALLIIFVLLLGHWTLAGIGWVLKLFGTNINIGNRPYSDKGTYVEMGRRGYSLFCFLWTGTFFCFLPWGLIYAIEAWVTKGSYSGPDFDIHPYNYWSKLCIHLIAIPVLSLILAGFTYLLTRMAIRLVMPFMGWVRIVRNKLKTS